MSRFDSTSMSFDAELPDIPGYRIVRPLGQGGMATVYLAMQENFEREVALKIMSPNLLAADHTYGERFLREARIVARIVHPHIVTVHDVGVHEGLHYLAMEYVAGQDLREARSRLSLRQSLTVIRQIAGALEEAHHKGYVHRDIKPENILIHRNGGRAVLTDFGIARPLGSDDDSAQLGGTIGTPAFMSPEQALGQPIDHRSDLYSLGVVCYFLLIGQVPYAGDSPVAVGMKHALDPIPRLPAGLAIAQRFIDTALAKHPDHRFQTGDSFASAIDVLVATLDESHEQFWKATAFQSAGGADFTRLSGADATRIPGMTPQPGAGTASPANPGPRKTAAFHTATAGTRPGSRSGTTADAAANTVTEASGQASPTTALWQQRAQAAGKWLLHCAREFGRWMVFIATVTARALAQAGRFLLAQWRRHWPAIRAFLLKTYQTVAEQISKLMRHVWAHRAERKTQLQVAGAVVIVLLTVWLLNDKDWTTSSARQAYREGDLSKAEYNEILADLKAEHQAQLAELLQQLEADELSREEYLQAVKEAKQAYTGQEDCGSWLGC